MKVLPWVAAASCKSFMKYGPDQQKLKKIKNCNFIKKNSKFDVLL